MKKYYFTVIACFFVILSSYSQSDCSTAIPLCTDANSGGVVNGFGADDFNGRTSSGCLGLGSGVNTIETNSFWFKIKLAESGEFGFNIIPNDISEDWDFGVYGPNPTCGALSDPIACNYIKVSTTGYTGVGVDPILNTQTDAYDDWMDVSEGDEYLIMINQYDGNNAGFSIQWVGAVIDNNTEPLDCSILVDLGPDRDLCTGQNTILNATTFGASNYEWFLYNDATSAYESMGINTETILVNTTGNYMVEVTYASTGEVKSDDIVVTIHDIPVISSVTNIMTCDPDGDGVEGFNLESRTAEIINGQVGMTVTYHESEIFAKAGASPQNSPYTSGNKTIWARIENAANNECYDIVSFDLAIVQSPSATKPPDLLDCDDDQDGKMIFNLDAQTPIIVGNQTGLDVTYYISETQAEDRKGWIIDTATYLTKTRTIWVRVEPGANSTCPAFTSFEIKVLTPAVANIPDDSKICDDNNDGFYQFDFNALKDVEILGTQNPGAYEIIYFASQASADNNINPLPNPYTNVTPYALETIYARIQNAGSDSANCYDTTSFSLQVFDSAMPLDASEIPNLSYCDDSSDGDDTNGLNTFDLTIYESLILNGQSSFVFDISYYKDPGYTLQIGNPQAYANSISGGETIYVRVTNSNPNNESCYTDTSFNIEVLPLPFALLTTFEFFQCDEDGAPDGVVDFNLEESDTFVTLGDDSLDVTYHLTPIDAASGINVQNKYPFSNNTASTVYARVASLNGCYRIVPVDLVVSSTAFPSSYMRELIECDDDATIDGIHLFDLAQTTSEIITLFPSQNLGVAYYRSQQDALLESNKINPSNAYLSETPYSQTIWVRVESSLDGGCYAIGPVIQLTVNPRPQFELDSTGIVCLNSVPLLVSTYDALDTYTYEWTDEAGNVISQQPSAEIYQAGVYTVIATSNVGCVSFPKTITIAESDIADISPEDVIINENSNNNSITIITENQNLGIGDYEFALDNIMGPYQDSSTFTQVLPGKHTIYVQDKNGCGIAQVTIYVLGFPNFFTPNNDGSNDTWQVRGVDSAIFPQSSIDVFDRYGKVMASFDATHPGWDGMYINRESISSDYWYLARLVDYNGDVRVYRGHFSLVR